VRVHNLRYGFATNSSSSHSIILATGLHDNLIDGDHLEFGWRDFTLASPDAKADYIAVAAYGHYVQDEHLSPEDATAKVNTIFGLEHQQSDYHDGYIDHQSDPSFPRARIPAQADALWGILKKNIIENPKAVILGGNDNSEGHPLRNEGPVLPMWDMLANPDSYFRMLPGKKYPLVFVADPLGHVTIFNQLTGTKVRVGLNGSAVPTHSTAPELVDIKITDYCKVPYPVVHTGVGPNGEPINSICAACYQSSTKKGRHADIAVLLDTVEALKEAGCLELAIGGGEPFDHPAIGEFLYACRDADIVPSVSTQSWSWLKSKELTQAVRECCGAVALSTQDPAHVMPWLAEADTHGFKAHFHYVLGINPLENFAALLREYPESVKRREVLAQLSGPAKPSKWEPYVDNHPYVVLLAYKAIGRGANKSPYDYADWMKVIKREQDRLQQNKQWFAWTVAVDSFMVPDLPNKAPAVPRVLYEQADGRFSCYFDAAKQEWAKHSFEPPENRIKGGPGDWAKAWAQITTEEVVVK